MILLLSLGFLGLGAKLWLSSAHFPELIEAEVASALAGRLEIGHIALSFPFGVEAEDVSLWAPDGQRAVRIRALSGRCDPLALLGGRIRCGPIHARGAEVSVTRTASGSVAIAEAVAPRSAGAGGGSGPDLVLDGIQIDDLAIIVDLPSAAVRTRGATLSAGRVVFAGDRLDIDARLDAPRVDLAKAGSLDPLGASELQAPLRLRRAAGVTTIFLDAVRAVLDPKLEIQAGGSFEASSTGRIALSLKAALDADDFRLRRLLPPAVAETLDPSGHLAVQADLSGALLGPEVRLDVRGSDLEIAGIPLEQAAVTASISAAQVIVDGLEIKSGAGRARAKATVQLLPPARWSVEVRAESLPIGQILASKIAPELLPSAVSGRLRLAGTSSRSRVNLDGELALADLPKKAGLPLVGPFQLAARGALEGSRLSLAEGHLRGGGLELSGSGLISAKRLDLTAAGAIDRLSRLARSPAFELGPARAEAHLEGPLDALTILGHGKVQAIRTAGLPPLGLETDFSLRERQIRVSGAVLSSTIGEVRASGSVDLGPPEDPAAVQLNLELLALSLEPGGLTRGQVGGTLKGHGHLEGPPKALSGRLSLVANPLAVAGLFRCTGPLEVELKAGAVTVAGPALILEEGGVLKLSAEAGPFGGDRPAPIRGTATIEDLQLSPLFAPWLGPSAIVGAASLHAEVSQDLEHPEISVLVDSKGLSVQEHPFLKLRAGAKGPLEHLDLSLSLVGEGGTLSIGGSLNAKETTAALEILGRNLILPRLAEEGLLSRLGARVDAELRLWGPLRSPRLDGRIQFTQGTLDGAPYGPRSLSLRLFELDVPGLRFRLESGNALVADGSLRYAPLSVEARFRTEGLSIPSFLPRPSEELSYDARLSSEGQLRYGADGLRLEAELHALEIALENDSFKLEPGATLSVVGEDLSLVGVHITGSTGELRLSAARRAGVIEAKAEGDLDASILTAFVPPLAKADGRISFHLSAEGSLEEPRLLGAASVETPVTLRLRTGLRELVLDAGKLKASAGQLELSEVRGRIGSGSFSANGRALLEDFRPKSVDVSVEASQFPFRSGELSAEANLNLRLSGPVEGPRLSGDLELIRARYLKRMKLDNFSFVSEPSDEDSGPALGALENVELDLKVRSLGDLSLDVDAASISAHLGMNVALHLGGTLGAPLLEGRVYAEDGKLRFPAAKLDVVRADVDFDPLAAEGERTMVSLRAEGEVESPASLDPSARASFVVVSLEGPLESLNLDLSSEGLDRLQTLALLITGKSALSDFSGNNTAIEGALGFAGTQLTSPITAFIEDQLEEKLNLDLKLGAEVSSGGFRVTAQKEFTQRLVVEGSYQRSFAEAAEVTTTVRAVLFLFDRAFFEASTTAVRKTSSTSSSDPVTTGRIELKYQVLGK
ncbi:MAG: translocation/assembly module TamB domain-containing protein [Myxococcota bacterium]